MTDQCLFLSLSNDLMRPPFYVFFPRFALKHLPCKWAIKKSLTSSFIIFLELQQLNSLSSSSNSACHLSHSARGQPLPAQLLLPPSQCSLCTGCHLLPTLNPKKGESNFQEKKGGGHMELLNSHWALISKGKITWNNTCDKWRWDWIP